MKIRKRNVIHAMVSNRTEAKLQAYMKKYERSKTAAVEDMIELLDVTEEEFQEQYDILINKNN